MKFFAKTDLGKLRQVNQDYYIAENRKVGILPNLFIVADGVGSNSESAFASKHCSNFVLDQLMLCKEGNDYIEELSKAYRLANTDLYYRIVANPSYKGMGTTMVSVTVVNDRAIIVNVGDSRCYHIRNSIKQITHDHSIAEELVKEHAIERDSEKYKELKSQLSRAFGASKKIEPDFFEINLAIGDYLLLCSDGLSNMVSNERIYEIITKDTNIETKVNELIEEANKNGGRDNIAIILICVDEILKVNTIFEKEKEVYNLEATKKLKPVIDDDTIEAKETKKNSLKDILAKHINGKYFGNRSRKKKEEGNDYEK